MPSESGGDLPPVDDHGEWAMRYAEAGLAVFPCIEGEKAPATARGFHDATTDIDQIMAWWSRMPRANVAIACGRPSGVFVLDADINRDTGDPVGRRSRDALVRDAWSLYCNPNEPIGHLEGCWKADTPSGGSHWYYRLPAVLGQHGLDVLTRSPDRYPKLDIRGTGAYVVAPPSVLTKGGRYTWYPVWNPLQIKHWRTGDDPLHPAIASYLRDIGVIGQPSTSTAGQAIDIGTIGAVVTECDHRRLIEAIVAATPALAEGQQYTRTVHDPKTGGQVKRTTAGRDDYLATAVAWPIWHALADVHAADTARAEATPGAPATSDALATLIDAVRRANARYATPLPDPDVIRIARGAARVAPAGPQDGAPPPRIVTGGRSRSASAIDLTRVAAHVASLGGQVAR